MYPQPWGFTDENLIRWLTDWLNGLTELDLVKGQGAIQLLLNTYGEGKDILRSYDDKSSLEADEQE